MMWQIPAVGINKHVNPQVFATTRRCMRLLVISYTSHNRAIVARQSTRQFTQKDTHNQNM